MCKHFLSTLTRCSSVLTLCLWHLGVYDFVCKHEPLYLSWKGLDSRLAGLSEERLMAELDAYQADLNRILPRMEADEISEYTLTVMARCVCNTWLATILGS